MKKYETGFTLIELLLVITIVAALSILVLPSMVRTIQNIETNHFFDKLNSDVLYAQNKALTQDEENVRIRFFHDHYRIITTAKQLKKEPYPKHLNLRQANHVISYSNTGTVKDPGTFVIYDDNNKKYEITFPFGKGRYYVKTIE